MSIDLRSAIHAWREAAEDAHAAEKLLVQTWHDYLDREGPAATQGLLREVAHFRSRAEARLHCALALMRSPAQHDGTDACDLEAPARSPHSLSMTAGS